MIWGMKNQLFWDGNKRTSMLAANKEMIVHGKGVISVPIDKIELFNRHLSDFYNDDANKDALKQFVYDECISGIAFE